MRRTENRLTVAAFRPWRGSPAYCRAVPGGLPIVALRRGRILESLVPNRAKARHLDQIILTGPRRGFLIVGRLDYGRYVEPLARPLDLILREFESGIDDS